MKILAFNKLELKILAFLAFAWERNLESNPLMCLMHFKIANVNIVWLLLPNAQVKVHFFHFSQSLW